MAAWYAYSSRGEPNRQPSDHRWKDRMGLKKAATHGEQRLNFRCNNISRIRI
jgi:hypothetical protein